MQQKSEYKDDSMLGAQSIFIDNDEPIVDQQIEEKLEFDENIDDFKDVSNITFTFDQCTQFEMDCPAKEIIIAISKYFMREFNDVISELKVNLTVKENKLLIITEKDEKEYKEIENAIYAFYSQFKSARLYFDIDSQRTIHPSNYILRKCQESSYYLVKIKNLDNQIELYLVTKENNLSAVQSNIQEKFRGVRIFFQDVTNRMTLLRKNINYKRILTQLRVKYYGLRMAQEITDLFNCIEFQDTINKNQIYCSQIIGLNLPYHLKGKADLAQKIFRYIASLILNLLVVYIKFKPTTENVKNARLLENISNNLKNSQNKFLCTSQTFVEDNLIAFLGHPSDLQHLFKLLKEPNIKDKFTSDFVQSFQVGILTKNYDYCYEATQSSFQQIEQKLKKKQIIITAEDQLKQIQITEKITFISYCNLIEFLCKQKFEQTTEASERKQQIEYAYISSQLGQQSEYQKLFDSLEFNYKFDLDRQENRNVQNNSQRSQGQRLQQPILQEQRQVSTRASEQSSRENRNQNHPRSQQQQKEKIVKEEILQGDEQKQTIDKLFEKSDQSKQELSQEVEQQQFASSNSNEDSESKTDSMILPSLGNTSTYSQEDDEEIQFQQPIIQSVNDSTKKTIVSQEYQKYFKLLTKQNLDQTVCLDSTNQELKFGFIPIKKVELFTMKRIHANYKIFLNEQEARHYCSQNNHYYLIQVRINEQAEMNEQDQGNYILLRKANQVYPMKQL